MTRELRRARHLDRRRTGRRHHQRLPPQPAPPLRPRRLGQSLPPDQRLPLEHQQQTGLLGLLAHRPAGQGDERQLRPAAGYGERVVQDAVAEQCQCVRGAGRGERGVRAGRRAGRVARAGDPGQDDGDGDGTGGLAG